MVVLVTQFVARMVGNLEGQGHALDRHACNAATPGEGLGRIEPAMLRRAIDAFAALIKDNDVEVDLVIFVIGDYEVPGTCVVARVRLKALLVQQGANAMKMLLLNNDINVIMGAGFFAHESVNSPAAIQPDIAAQPFDCAHKVADKKGRGGDGKSGFRVSLNASGACYCTVQMELLHQAFEVL